MKILKIILIVFYTCIYLNAQETSLDSLINKAVQISPNLKMLRAKYLAAESRVNINSNLPDPTLTLGVMNLPVNSFSFTEDAMTGKIVGLSQDFPFPGKLSSTKDVFQKDAEIVSQEINDSKNKIIKNISQDYYELIFTRKAIQTAKKSKDLLKNISDVVKANYTVSEASHHDVLKTEMELVNMEEKIIELKEKENSITAELNSFLLKNRNSPIYTQDLPEIPYHNFTTEKLDSIAKQNRPFLLGISLAEKKTHLQENLAEYGYYPSFNFSAQYMQRDNIMGANMPSDDMMSFIIGISLPLNYGGRVSSAIQEAEAMQNMYNEQYEMALQKLNSSFGSSISKLNSLEQRIKLIEQELLPLAHHAYVTGLSAYQADEMDFINVIEAQNNLFQIETKLYKLKTDYLKEIAELKFLTGAKEF